MNDIQVRFEPEGKQTTVAKGTSILDAAKKAGVPLFHPCGGKGICGRCQVRVTGTSIPQTEQEKELFVDMTISEQWHLSCLTVLDADCTVHVPPTSTITISAKKQSLQSEVDLGEAVFTKRHKTVTPPGLEDSQRRSHAEAISDAFDCSPSDVQFSAFADLPKLFPYYESKWDMTAFCEDEAIYCLELGDTCSRFFGLAFDIGTTSLVVSLVNLSTGEVLEEVSAGNPQAIWGADVIARIEHIQNDPQGLNQLRLAVVQSLTEMSADICGRYDLQLEDIYAVTFVGNTIMEHTLLGISPEAIASMPFHPAFRHGWLGYAREIGLPLHHHARVYVSPVVSGYIGGDTLAVILATGLHQSEKLTLAVDLGTNGELILGKKGEIYACAAAAGPAFEGGRIRCGMRAVPGAIDSVTFDDKVTVTTIGDAPPLGICGSGILDVMAELVRTGILEETGAFRRSEDLPDLPETLRERIEEKDGQLSFLLASDGQRPIRITQRDVREFQLAKGAVKAGCEEMLRNMGCATEQVERVMISGAFGAHLRKESVQQVGLLPEFPLEKIVFIGNGAMQGSRMMLMSRSARNQVEELKDEIRYLELSTSIHFQQFFADSMQF